MNLKLNRLIKLLITAGIIALFLSGCATAKPYSVNSEAGESSTVNFINKKTKISPVYYNGEEFPEAEKSTYWNPISFPSGAEFDLTVHVYYAQSSNGSLGLLAALATSAIASSRTVDRDVTITCPPLAPDCEYNLEFRKGAGLKGSNLLVLTEKDTKNILFKEEFESY